MDFNSKRRHIRVIVVWGGFFVPQTIKESYCFGDRMECCPVYLREDQQMKSQDKHFDK